MKYILLSLLFALFGISSWAQRPRYGVMIEHGGASRTVGLAFDSRLGKSKHWGYKVGLARVKISSMDEFFNSEGRTNGWMVPAQVHYLVGHKRHFLEIGMGLSVGYFESYFFNSNGEDCKPYEGFTDTEPIKTNTHGPTSPFGWGGNATLAYRYQMMKGAFFRVGVTDNFNLGNDNNYIAPNYVLAPFLSFGVAF